MAGRGDDEPELEDLRLLRMGGRWARVRMDLRGGRLDAPGGVRRAGDLLFAGRRSGEGRWGKASLRRELHRPDSIRDLLRRWGMAFGRRERQHDRSNRVCPRRGGPERRDHPPLHVPRRGRPRGGIVRVLLGRRRAHLGTAEDPRPGGRRVRHRRCARRWHPEDLCRLARGRRWGPRGVHVERRRLRRHGPPIRWDPRRPDPDDVRRRWSRRWYDPPVCQ